MKDREKVKALLNGIDVVNVEQWTQISSAHIAAKLKTWNTSNHWVLETAAERRCSKSTSLNLLVNSCL